MKLTSEQKKQLYAAVEASEELKTLLEPLKEDLVTAGQVTKELEELKLKTSEYDELNIPDLKSKAEFVDKKGGVDAIIGVFADKEGYGSDLERVKREKEEYKSKYDGLVQAGVDKDKEISHLRLKNATSSSFTEQFTTPLVHDDCVSKGVLYSSEDGSPWVNTPTGPKPLSDGGMEYIKGLAEYKGAVRAPNGSDDNLNSPDIDNKQNKPKGHWFEPKGAK